ncbi:hypothetical protein ACHAXS_003249 [Conticribra weissflogii]
MEKELLSIVMVPEEFCSMLLEYGPIIIYHPVKKNAIVNIFSHLPCCDVLPISVEENDSVICFYFTSKSLGISNNPDLLECFLNFPLPEIAKINLLALIGYIPNNKQPRSHQILRRFMSISFLLMIMSLCGMPYAFPNEKCLTK